MLSSIILIPIGRKVDLTSISLNLIYLMQKKKIKTTFFKIIYEKCAKSSLDHTTRIINKNKLSNFIVPIIVKDILVLSDKKKYNFFLEKCIEKYYSLDNTNKIMLLEGISTKYNSYIERKFNIDFARSINSKVIFVCNHDTFFYDYNFKIIKHFFLKYFRMNNSCILGTIVHKYEKKYIKNCFKVKPYIDNKNIQNKIFYKKLLKLHHFKKSLNLLTTVFWTIREYKICTSMLFNIISIKYLYDKKTFLKKIKFFIFENFSINCNKHFYKYCILIVDTNNSMIFNNFLSVLYKNFYIGAILLVGNKNNVRRFTKLFFYAYRKNIPVFFSNNSIFKIFDSLKTFSKYNLDIYYNMNKSIIKNNFLFKIDELFKNIFSRSENFFLTPYYFKYYLKKRAKFFYNSIIFPEGYEIRILKAVSICAKEKIARCVLLGNKKKIQKLLIDNNIYLDNNISIINPKSIRNKYINLFIKSRLPKILSESDAKKLLQDNCVLATLMLKNNEFDCLVSGSANTTANTIRPALQIIKTKPSSSLVSSFFFMLLEEKVVIYADCAININPDSYQLAEIAIETANSARKFGIFPKIAMISYSTESSGSGSSVDKVRQATAIIKRKKPNLLVDGPVQYDVAISSKISKLKNYNSNISGIANIFIFPDLNTGNTVYKAVQNSTNAIAIGPILQGINKPVNDLSRGATIEDIIYTSAVTSIQLE
ncbi:phosphate acetyltransferase [Buchnera aphidicola (Chaitoregma tattakana)]|uniref:phosphate acetyltransferase n=1 Tax=Buchnera aphidicola TaxID=9 RepID=UPI0031B81153